MKTQSQIFVGAEGTQYGNWMSAPVMKMAYGIVGFLAVILILISVLWQNLIAIVIGTVVFLGVLTFALFLQKCRNAFSFRKGKLMDKIQQNLVEYLDWNGNGTVLDIGCGSAALSVRVAKTFENASLVGVDYWGPMWDYSESMCCKNAELEGVATRCTFKPGNAIKLDFADESFDAVVSNFMYHEVLGAPDKKALILESLRVLKKGGAFSLQDYFDRESMFGSPQELVDYLKAHGISEVFYEGNIDNKPWIPKYVLKSFIIKDIAVIWGKK